jgi:hypothetical protein
MVRALGQLSACSLPGEGRALQVVLAEGDGRRLNGALPSIHKVPALRFQDLFELLRRDEVTGFD